MLVRILPQRPSGRDAVGRGARPVPGVGQDDVAIMADSGTDFAADPEIEPEIARDLLPQTKLVPRGHGEKSDNQMGQLTVPLSTRVCSAFGINKEHVSVVIWITTGPVPSLFMAGSPVVAKAVKDAQRRRRRARPQAAILDGLGCHHRVPVGTGKVIGSSCPAKERRACGSDGSSVTASRSLRHAVGERIPAPDS